MVNGRQSVQAAARFFLLAWLLELMYIYPRETTHGI
jgi:hypothetical protein